MSTALYIVTKEDHGDLDVYVDGKAVGHLDNDVLQGLCGAAGVRSLLDFVSEDPEELADFLDGEGIELDEEAEIAPEEWFAPEDGLAAIRGLIEHLRENPGAVGNAAAVIDDLSDYEAVLAKLAERNIPWHFAIDY